MQTSTRHGQRHRRLRLPGADLYSFGFGDFARSSGVAVLPSPTGKAYVSDGEAGEIDVYGPGPIKSEFELSILKTQTGAVASSPPGINCGLHAPLYSNKGQVIELEASPESDPNSPAGPRPPVIPAPAPARPHPVK